ncbi:MAG: hypothetical protein WAT39_24010 [Planctomycetota bacterium]
MRARRAWRYCRCFAGFLACQARRLSRDRSRFSVTHWRLFAATESLFFVYHDRCS